MKRLIRTLLPLVAVFSVISLVAGTATSYAAAGDEFELEADGGGSISPGLGVTPAFQSVTFSGTVRTVGRDHNTTHQATLSCSFSGNSSIAETGAQGQGGGGLSCSGTATVITPTTASVQFNVGASASCTLSYVRVGAAVVVTGSCTVTLSGKGTITFQVVASVCAFAPNDVNPTTSYRLACAGLAASTA